MRRTIRSLHSLGLPIMLCFVVVLSTLLAVAVIEPSVAQAQRYIVDISLGDNPVPSGTGTSVTVNMNDDYIYDTFSTSATGFTLHAWVYRKDSRLTHAPSCHGSNWPSNRPITPNNDGNRMVVTFRISGSCPLWEESGYSIRADVIARVDNTDTVVANRAIDFTVEGVPPTVTPTATPTPTTTSTPTATKTPSENHTATPTSTATETPDNSVMNPPVRPTQRLTSRPTLRPTSTPTLTPTPTRVPRTTGSGSGQPPLEPLSQPTSAPEVPLGEVLIITSVVPTSTPPVSTPAPETDKPDPPPPTTCIVAHAAAPVQVCRDNDTGALHFHFVGQKDVFSGPMFPSIVELTSAYPLGYVPSEVELYRGFSTGTGKEVFVHFLTYSSQLRVSTYYADSTYDENKPYVFTIDQDGTVTHLAW